MEYGMGRDRRLQEAYEGRKFQAGDADGHTYCCSQTLKLLYTMLLASYDC